MPILAGQLVQDQQLVSVAPSESLTRALTLMIEHDFSQLPVVDPEGKPLGIITCASIAKALLHLGAKIEELRVNHALVKISTHPAEEDLLYLLDTILKVSAVFVVDTTDKLIGIITEYDTTQYFRQRAEDLVLINDIEDALKRHLQIAYDAQGKTSTSLNDAIDGLSNSLDGIRRKSHSSLRALSAKLTNVKPEQKDLDEIVDRYFPPQEESRSFSDLTLSEFIQLAQKNWSKLEPVFRISQQSWSKMMEDIRIIRNKLFHFKGDTSAVERNKLQFCSNWYTNHPPLADKEAKVTDLAQDVTEPSISNQDKQDEVIVENNTKFTKSVIRSSMAKLISNKYKPIVDLLDKNDKLPFGTELKVSTQLLNSMVSGGLATAAREQVNWWNRSDTYSRDWIRRGWKVTAVDSLYVIFERQNLPYKQAPINTTNSWEIAYWCAVFNCSEEQLMESISVAGPYPVAIEPHLDNLKANKLFIQPTFS